MVRARLSCGPLHRFTGGRIGLHRQVVWSPGLYIVRTGPHARRKRKLFATTETLDIAIAAEAIIGDNIHPVQ